MFEDEAAGGVAADARTMKAMRVHAFGGPDAIHAEDVPVPVPGPEEVLVKVRAAGVGPWDGWIRSGRSVLPQPLPLTLGSDVSGAIVAVGDGSSRFQAGDEVYGVTNKRFTDGYAEYALCKAGMIAAKPTTLSHAEAASAPVIAVTAWQALFDHGGGEKGQTVLVHGAAGNVGRFAVQLAKTAGLRVVATSLRDDRAELTRLGADTVLVGGERGDEQVDLVVDFVGGEGQSQLFDAIKSGGRLISAVAEPDRAQAESRNVKASFMLVDVRSETLTDLAAMFDEGSLVTQVGTILPLADAVTAHRMLEGEEPHKAGKIVLTVEGR
jgi:NADPH:quinone reductase-like Zn-dependent oxidoreductase